MEGKELVAWIALVLSIVSLAFAIRRNLIAQWQIEVAGRIPWLNFVMGTIRTEMEGARDERVVYEKLCTTGFATQDEKSETIKKLEQLRDESQGRQTLLMALYPEWSSVMKVKDKLEQDDDSFLTSSDLFLKSDQGDRAVARFRQTQGEYIRAAKAFAEELPTKRPLKKSKKAVSA